MTKRGWFVAAVLGVLAAGCVPAPDPAVVARQKGDELLAKNDFAGAEAEFQKSVDLKPKQENTWEKLAMAQLRQEKRDQAAATLAKKAELDPDPAKKAEALRNAAGLFLQGADRDKAEPWLKQVLAIEPNDESSITWMAELYADRGGARSNAQDAQPEQLDVALGYYAKLAALKPQSTAPLAHTRIVLTKYMGYLEARKKAAQDTLSRKKGPELQETKDRIAALDGKIAELQPKMKDVNDKIAELKKPRPAAAP